MALKLRATPPLAPRVLDDSSCAPGDNTPAPLERSPPVSFKRLLGRQPTGIRASQWSCDSEVPRGAQSRGNVRPVLQRTGTCVRLDLPRRVNRIHACLHLVATRDRAAGGGRAGAECPTECRRA